MPTKSKLRVFLDTNVIFSGLYSPQKAPGRILRNFILGELSIVISQQVLEETVRTVKEKIPQALPALNTLLVNSPPEIIQDPPFEEVQRWSKLVHFEDALILAAAISAQPDFFVTGDKHFLDNADIANQAGLRFITPTGLIKLLD